MKLFRKKKRERENQEITYEIFGGFTIIETSSGYEITWKSPNLTTITVHSRPLISEDIETKREGKKILILTNECKLILNVKEGNTTASIIKY